jgi:hypothetical protein
MLDSSGAVGAGRPTRPPRGDPDISALARVHGVACIERLVRILDGTDVRASVEAAKIILDRGYGAPSQPLVFDAKGVCVEVDTSGESEEAGRYRMNGEARP